MPWPVIWWIWPWRGTGPHGLVSTADAAVVAVAGVGFCGGFTTFSTACLQTVRLLRGWRAAMYAVVTATGCLLLAGAGRILAGVVVS